jgi:hypothetical protein
MTYEKYVQELKSLACDALLESTNTKEYIHTLLARFEDMGLHLDGQGDLFYGIDVKQKGAQKTLLQVFSYLAFTEGM